MTDRLIKISKFMSKFLRHAPQDLGLTLQPGGWVEVDKFLAASKAKADFHISRDELDRVVATDNKSRYSFDDTGKLIRANQGHSVEVDLQLEEKEPPEFLYHGTVQRFIDSIFETGLNKGQRHHVHLSSDLETATKVGSRRGEPVILTVASGRMKTAGYKFYLSANGVWLTDEVPASFISRN